MKRQESDCRALCERKGWDVVGVYVDNDISAYSGKPRPEWSRLLGDIKEGAVGALVAWHVDRLTRSPRELEDVIELAEKHGIDLATVTGDIDISTPTGRLVARMLGAAARHESEHKSERVRRKARELAEAGKPNGRGGHRPFGYADDRVTVVESEAAVIRECATRVLAGESLNGLSNELNQRGTKTVTGKAWRAATLGDLLVSARISGRREHRPRGVHETRRDRLGQITADAVWPAIITVEESDRLRRMLTDPSRRPHQTVARKYLLSGILVCGKCGRGLVGRPRRGVTRYGCPDGTNGGGCGGTITDAERTDALVRDMVLVALESDKMRTALSRQDEVDPELLASIKRDEDALSDLAAEKDDGVIGRSEYLTRRARIEKRLEASRAKAARQSGAQPLSGLTGTYDDLRARWEAMNTSQRRAVVAAVLEQVEVRPADPRKKWDPDRFVPTWRA